MYNNKLTCKTVCTMNNTNLQSFYWSIVLSFQKPTIFLATQFTQYFFSVCLHLLYTNFYDIRYYLAFICQFIKLLFRICAEMKRKSSPRNDSFIPNLHNVFFIIKWCLFGFNKQIQVFFFYANKSSAFIKLLLHVYYIIYSNFGIYVLRHCQL